MDLWQRCLEELANTLSDHHLQTWIMPLQAVHTEGQLRLLAPNRFVADRVQHEYVEAITQALATVSLHEAPELFIEIGQIMPSSTPSPHIVQLAEDPPVAQGRPVDVDLDERTRQSNLNADFVFATFVEGKSNQMALAACTQVGAHPGQAYNPLFIYGGTGLGKTHLMHAVGNAMRGRNPNARIVYQNAEHFVADMVSALQHRTINDFKLFYRTLDALLIDDIQFLSGKDRSQEEFFYTFNNLLEGRQQVILTCDRLPREVAGLEERLKSRFGSGLTVAIEPPEFETRVAILMNKAEQAGIRLPTEVGYFIAKRIRSNVRDLEGAMKRVYANAQFTQRPITVELAREALSDVISLQDRLVTMENIQRAVAEYYEIRLSDLLSDSRLRAVSRPRQLAMSLCKELTDHSLPEIGEAFGGRNHTTVLRACRVIDKLRQEDRDVRNDFANLLTKLTN